MAVTVATGGSRLASPAAGAAVLSGGACSPPVGLVGFILGEGFAVRFGDRYAPADLLKTHAADGDPFRS